MEALVGRPGSACPDVDGPASGSIGAGHPASSASRQPVSATAATAVDRSCPRCTTAAARATPRRGAPRVDDRLLAPRSTPEKTAHRRQEADHGGAREPRARPRDPAAASTPRRPATDTPPPRRPAAPYGYGGQPMPGAPAYAQYAQPQGPIGHMRPTGMTILLFFVTLGIWGFIYYYQTQEEMKRHTRRGHRRGHRAGDRDLRRHRDRRSSSATRWASSTPAGARSRRSPRSPRCGSSPASSSSSARSSGSSRRTTRSTSTGGASARRARSLV